MIGLIHTVLGSSSLIAHVLHSPPPPPANSFVIGPAVINTHARIRPEMFPDIGSLGGESTVTKSQRGSPPGTQGVVSTPTVRSLRMSAPGIQACTLLCAYRAGPGNMVFCTWYPCARDSDNKTAASAHGMGSGGLSVDVMSIGCLGVDRHGERFFRT